MLLLLARESSDRSESSPWGRPRRWWMHGLSDRFSAGFAAGAPAAKVKRELFRLFAGLRVDHDLPQRHPAAVAGVEALVLVVMGCRREGIAGRRYSVLVHSTHPLCGPRLRGAWTLPRGLLTLSTAVLAHLWFGKSNQASV